MLPIIDHIQITVKDLSEAEPFYDALMTILGFDMSRKGKGKVDAHEFEVIEYFHPNLIFGINSPREPFRNEVVHRRKPGAVHHIAFKATSREEVNAAYDQIKNIPGIQLVDEPKFYPQHGKSYYALFFKDPGGIKLEIVFDEERA